MKERDIIIGVRAGNYVMCGKTGSLCKVVSVESGGFDGGRVSVTVGDILINGFYTFIDAEDIMPIPLTVELINYALSGVFQKAERADERTEFEVPCEVLTGVYGVRNWSLIEDEEEKDKWWLTAGTGSYLTEVKSLHHLQNIFFDLEGREMTIYEYKIERVLSDKEKWGKVKD